MSKNQHKVSFHQFDYNPQIKSFWVGTKIYFSAENGNQVYIQVKKNQFNWRIFYLNITLSRMDVCYFRITKPHDFSINFRRIFLVIYLLSIFKLIFVKGLH